MSDGTALSAASAPSRVAEPDEGIGLDELQLAARNHGVLLEALRHDVTPVGLHYLLTHYDVPDLDAAAWRLEIGGGVSSPMSLGLDELLERPAVTQRVTIECAGNGRARLRPRPVSQPWLVDAVGTAEWTGTPLASLLREAGVGANVVDVVFTGADHGVERGVEQDYARGIPVAEAMRPEVLLVYAMNGAPLPPQHGFPLRLVVPGWYGMAQVKWLTHIAVLETPFEGFQNSVAYRIRADDDDPGTPVTRIRPRALMVPPGFPDFLSRRRFVRVGAHQLVGRAWSGQGPVSTVELSIDGGQTWSAADLEPADQAHPWSWRRWLYTWQARQPGAYELCVRAADSTGDVQPVDQPWNLQGMANNEVQRVPVVVLEP